MKTFATTAAVKALTRFALVALAAAFCHPLAAFDVPSDDPTADPWGEGGAHKPQVETAGSYDPYPGNATRVVHDLSVPGAVGSGLHFTRYWNSTDFGFDTVKFYGESGALQAPFGLSGWRHNYYWWSGYQYDYTDYDGENPAPNHQPPYTFEKFTLHIRYPDGRNITAYTSKVVRPTGAYSLNPPTGFWNVGSGITDRVEVLTVTQGAPGSGGAVQSFNLYRSDGSTVYFVGDRATKIKDRHG